MRAVLDSINLPHLSFSSGREVHGTLTKYVRRSESTYRCSHGCDPHGFPSRKYFLFSCQECSDLTAPSGFIIVVKFRPPSPQAASSQWLSMMWALGRVISAQYGSPQTGSLCPRSLHWPSWDGQICIVTWGSPCPILLPFLSSFTGSTPNKRLSRNFVSASEDPNQCTQAIK